MYTMSTSILIVSVSDAKFKFGVCFRAFTEQASQKMSTHVNIIYAWFLVIVLAYTAKYQKTDNIAYPGDKKPSSTHTVWTEGACGELIMTKMLSCISEAPQIILIRGPVSPYTIFIWTSKWLTTWHERKKRSVISQRF